ncbi:UDP-glucuronosyl/UDP-glucosyltransferase [Trema orientale]|uniref:UDP-glucuronosyl/UDP-glucosyltransferase n=1 Tax=Trema orientale TaxID=63057 RepID=A0A2P5BTG3_TREOI|nr:UDP-glucuronosyl/UDP-glucosyltransferase [Trema orientale]
MGSKTSNDTVSPPPCQHIILFPFMSKGQIMPLLQLARLHLLCRRYISITFLTTPTNRPFTA